MATSDNLGYNTYVLGTIKNVIDSEWILVYNKNSFINDQNYSRITLYNLSDIFYNSLYFGEDNFNSNCLLIDRDRTGEFFEYNCDNRVTNGFNIIIYLGNIENSYIPLGYTEFMNTQGLVSEFVNIYLDFNIESKNIELKLTNSLYQNKDSLGKSLIGTELWQFTNSADVKNRLKRTQKDQHYSSHISSFMGTHNKSGIYLGDRTLLPSGDLTKLVFINDTNIFEGEEYSNFQIGYYGNDIVLYSWDYVNDNIGFYYKIVSLIDQKEYKYTRQPGIDIVTKYDQKETGKTLLYCAGKYLVFQISYKTYSKIALFDTSCDMWVKLDCSSPIVDPLDKNSIIYEFPESSKIQSYETAIEILPALSDIYLNLEEFINEKKSFRIIKKCGNWFFIDAGDLCIATCMTYSVYMTKEEYYKSNVINNNTLLISYDSYYIVYHGIRNKEYYTERARSVKNSKTLRFSDTLKIYICEDSEINKYTEYYNTSEISIVLKSDVIYNVILESYRRRPLYSRLKVPDKIIGAVRGIIFYLSKYNNINYL